MNASGGPALVAARRQLGRCPTGDARATPSFAHPHTRVIVHAVGPVFPRNAQERAVAAARLEAVAAAASPAAATRVDVDAHLHGLLGSAYRRALAVAQAHACESVGLCLLSAGVFRGAQPLEAVVEVSRRAASVRCLPVFCLTYFSDFPTFFLVMSICT